MSSLRAVVRNSAVLFAGTAASKTLVFASYLLLVRVLGAEGFGLYTLVFAYLAFFELLPDAGLDDLVVREASRRSGDDAAILGAAIALRALLILAALPLAMLAVPLVTDDPRGPLFVALGAVSWLFSFRRASLRSLAELPYRLALRMETPAVLGFAAEAAHLLMLFAFVPLGGIGVAVAAQGASALPFAVLLVVLAAKRLAPRLAPDSAEIRRLTRAALPLLVLLLANTVLFRADVLLLQVLRDAREVGIYAAPVRLVEVAMLMPVLLMGSVYPLLAGAAPDDPARASRLFRVSLRFLTAAVVPLVLAEMAWARELVLLLFGAEYEQSAAVLPILAATLVLSFAYVLLNAYFLATGLEKQNAALVAVAAGANIAANLVLIPRMGAVGAAWATLLAFGVRMAVTIAVRDTRPAAAAALRAILPATVSGALAVLAVRMTGMREPIGAAEAALAAAVYAAGLVVLRGLRLAELREIARALRRSGT
ncbi:MAG: oligosaccharide flippase family protein [Candidatus Eiseniibacteriota bacterium]